MDACANIAAEVEITVYYCPVRDSFSSCESCFYRETAGDYCLQDGLSNVKRCSQVKGAWKAKVPVLAETEGK